MTDLQLFKNCKIDNINRVSSFSTVEAQNAYYAGLISNQNGIDSTAINFQRMGDPIVLKHEYDEVLNYNYGRIKLKDVWYYFSITDLRVVQKELTQIIYRIDPWETARLQMNLTLGRGLVERGTITDDNIKYWLPQNELQPRLMNYSETTLFDTAQWSDFNNEISIITVTGHKYTNMNINMIKLKQGATIYDFMKNFNLGNVLKHDPRNVYDGEDYKLSDLRGAWVVPISYGISSRTVHFIDQGGISDNADYGYTLYGLEGRTGPDRNYALNFHFDLKTPLYHRDTERTFITDLRGVEIYTPPYGAEYSGKVYVEANVSYNTCSFRCYINNDKTDPSKRFTIMGEPLPVMGDAFNEYFTRQRQTDIEGRRIARNDQLAKGLLSTATSTATGYILGGIGGAGGSSAGVAGGGSIVESLGGYMIDKHITSPKQQAMLDNHYRAQRDELELTGDGFWAYNPLKIVTETWDEYSQTRFDNYIAVNGYSVNHYLTDCSSFYVPNGTLKGDFEIDGNVPESWKVAIREKFLKGVRIIE